MRSCAAAAHIWSVGGYQDRINGLDGMGSAAEVVTVVASVATAVGVFLAWWQIRESRKQAVTSFEDGMAREFREIAQRLPVIALLGDPLSVEDLEANLDDFFHYVDLSNEQVFLRQQGRIREATWLNWRVGIKNNLDRPAFAEAWAIIKEKSPRSFGELRRLEAEGFESDPRKWR